MARPVAPTVSAALVAGKCSGPLGIRAYSRFGNDLPAPKALLALSAAALSRCHELGRFIEIFQILASGGRRRIPALQVPALHRMPFPTFPMRIRFVTEGSEI
jgi:hypothetical protein